MVIYLKAKQANKQLLLCLSSLFFSVVEKMKALAGFAN